MTKAPIAWIGGVAVTIVYLIVISYLVHMGDAAHLVAAAILTAAPLAVMLWQSMRAARIQRGRIEEDLKALREDVKQTLKDHEDALLR